MNVNNSTFKMKDIKFKKVKISDAEFLYKLLSERIPKENISHKKMPSFLQHKKFIKSKPYSYWYIIFLEKNKIGTIYLTNINEIVSNKNHASPLFLSVNASPKIHNPKLKIRRPFSYNAFFEFLATIALIKFTI